MKRLLFTILLLSLFAGIASAALTYDETYYMQHLGYLHSGSSTTDPMYLFMNEIIGYVEGATAQSSLYFSPTDTAPTAAEGVVYWSDADNGLKICSDGTNFVDVDVSGASSLATAYTAGSKILAPTLCVEIEVADGSNNAALLLDYDDATTNAMDVLQITNAGDDAAAVSIQIDGAAGYDIQGTSDTWQIGIDGQATLVGLTVTTEDIALENGAEIQNSTDTEIMLLENSEDWIWDFTTDGVTIKSTTGLVAVNWGDVDSHTGLNAIAFDGAVANTITQTGTGDTDDLTIAQAGTADVSLILSSAGSITDALSLITTDTVGCIKINSSDNLDIDAADNITVDTADGSYTLTIAGSTNGDYTATVADNFSTVVVGTLTLQNTEAASDITINSVLGTVIIEGEEDCADAVLITADGSTASTLRLFNDTGTSVTEGAYSIEALSDAGGIELRSTSNLAKSVALTSDGGTTGSIWIFNDQGASVTEGGASIELLSDAGGVELRSTANLAKAISLTSDGGTTGSIYIFNDQGASVTEDAASIQISSDAGGINLQSDANLAKSIVLRTDGGTTETMYFHADQGSGACATTESDASIQLISDDGGIGLYSTLNGANAIRVEANGGANETVAISSVKGTGAASIDIDSTVGGITISCNAAGKDLELDSVLGSINIKAEEDAANAILITADGDTASTLEIFNDTGTSTTEKAASIQLLSDVGSIEIWSGLNGADAINIMCDSDTGAGITIFNDTGTGDESIALKTDVGGITLNAAAGSIDIEAVGGTDGDIILNSGDDMTFTVAGDLVITNTGKTTVSGAFVPDTVVVPDGAAYDVLANNAGQIHLIGDQTADITLDLPTEADDLYYKFVYVGGAEDAQDWIIDSESNTNYFIGGVMTHDDDDSSTLVVYSDGDSNSILTVLTPGAGTVVEIWCNGTQWYVTGQVTSGTDTAVTFAD